MNKLATGLIAVLVATVPVTAQNAEPATASPGAISVGSPFYGLDRAVDSAAVSIGLMSEADIAEERAAEADDAASNGNDEQALNLAAEAVRASERAANNTEASPGDASAANSSETGLARAEQALLQVQDKVPDQASGGIDNALEKINANQEKIRSVPSKGEGKPGDTGKPEDAGPGNGPDNGPENSPGGPPGY